MLVNRKLILTYCIFSIYSLDQLQMTARLTSIAAFGLCRSEETGMSVANHARTRRDALRLTAAGVAALLVAPSPASATPERIAEEVKKLFGGKKLLEGKIKLDLPSIAENGLVVPLNFEVESPMTDKDYVKAVHFFAEGNPHVGVASFTFTPMIPKAAGAIRIRLAKTQDIVAVAELSNGEIYSVRKEVKVTIGGCGG
jgi:sulfur-oxidizing protein SoxY